MFGQRSKLESHDRPDTDELQHFAKKDATSEIDFSWSKSGERTQAIAVAGIVILVWAAMAAWAFRGLSPYASQSKDRSAGVVLFVVVLVAVLAVGAWEVLWRYWRHQRQAHQLRVAAEHADKSARLAEEEASRKRILDLDDIWHVTQKRLNYYHNLATLQASKSFRSAQRAMWAGFLIILPVSIIGAALANTNVSKVVVGALGATGVANAAYVTRTFLRAQESASAQLQTFFSQPLEFSRYLAAERLVQELDGEARAAAVTAIAVAIVNIAGPATPTTEAQANSSNAPSDSQ